MEDELMDEFVIESKEHLENVENDFMQLEKADDEETKNLIGNIFRGIHSIKGAAGFFGLTVITELSHKMETLLSMMRAGEIEPEEKYIDNLLIGCDILNNLFADISNSNDVNITEVSAALDILIQGTSEVYATQSINLVELESDNKKTDISRNVDELTMRLMHDDDKTLFVIRYDLEEHKDMNPFKLMEILSEYGKMIDGKISEFTSKKKTISYYDILFSTNVDKKELGKILDVKKKFIITLNEKHKEIDSKELFEALKGVLLSRDYTGESLSLTGKSGEVYAFNIDVEEIKKLQEHHHYIYILKYDVKKSYSKRKITTQELISELGLLGTIQDLAMPLSETTLDAEFEGLNFQILFSTILDPTMISGGVHLDDEDIDEIIPIEESPLVNTMVLNKDLKTHFDVKRPSLKEVPPAQVAKPEVAQVAKPEVAPVKRPNLGALTTKNPAQVAKKEIVVKDDKKETTSQTVRIKVDVLEEMMRLAGELVLIRNQQLIIAETADINIKKTIQQLDLITSELQDVVMKSRMQPIGNILNKFPRIVRDLAKQLDKKIELEIVGKEVELDKTILENLTDPLTHMIRNCCDHAIELPHTRLGSGKAETGTVKLKAFHQSENIIVQIADDGKGLDPDMIAAKAIEKGLKTQEELEKMSIKDIQALIMSAGFSTAQVVSDVSGRGVGMDVVKSSIDKLGGVLDFESSPGVGTTITLSLPLTLAIIPSLIIQDNTKRYAIPQLNIDRSITLYGQDMLNKIEVAGNKEVYRLENQLLPMIRLSEVMADMEPFTGKKKAELTAKYAKERDEMRVEANKNKKFLKNKTISFLIIKCNGRKFGLIMDRMLGQEEIVVKPVHSLLKNIPIFSGSSVMGDGLVTMILNMDGLAEHSNIFSDNAAAEQVVEEKQEGLKEEQSVLLFENGEQEKFAVPLPLIKRIEHFDNSRIKHIGNKEFVTIDDESTQLIRLESVLNVSKIKEEKNLCLMIPKFATKPFAVVFSKMNDITNVSLDINTTSYMQDGLLGTLIVDEDIVLFPDLFRLIEIAEPTWYEDSKNKKEVLNKEDKKILFAEDSKFFQKMIKDYLASGGYKVTIANDGQEALDLFKGGKFDLILSDLEMPNMDGFEFMAEVRKDNKEVPTMALSSLSTEGDILKAKNVGFDEYNIKIDRDKLLHSVSNLLTRNESAGENMNKLLGFDEKDFNV